MIPHYPIFADISMEMRDELHDSFFALKDGISEFCFSNLFLFRRTYGYRLSRFHDGNIVISGARYGLRFFMLPGGLPDDTILEELFKSHDYIKCFSETHLNDNRVRLESLGYIIEEDRSNFDYLYLRHELANLDGKKFHKKRNMVNLFLKNYATYCEKPLTPELKKDAYTVLDNWKELKGEDADYTAAREAIERMEELGLLGYLYYVDDVPCAYSLGETLQRGKSFVVHFEKALDTYKGLYQFINKAFATVIPGTVEFINREQDLDDEGLRHAKMSYRPCGFVVNYKVKNSETTSL